MLLFYELFDIIELTGSLRRCIVGDIPINRGTAGRR